MEDSNLGNEDLINLKNFVVEFNYSLCMTAVNLGTSK